METRTGNGMTVIGNQMAIITDNGLALPIRS